MKLSILVLCLLLPGTLYAERTELSDGTYVDEYGEIHDNKYENTDVMAPWNDPLKQDDFLAPWNDSLKQDDFMAPWNNSLSGPQETNEYLRDNGERDADYFWK